MTHCQQEGAWVNLDSLLKIIEEEIVARERVEPKPSQPPQRRNTEQSPSIATALVTSISPSSPVIVNSHIHLIVVRMWPKSKQGSKSWRRVVVVSVVWRGPGHISWECRSSHKCPKCTGRHHISICLKGHSSDSNQCATINSATQPAPSNPPEPTKSGLNPDVTTFVAQPTSVTMCVGVNRDSALTDSPSQCLQPTKATDHLMHASNTG